MTEHPEPRELHELLAGCLPSGRVRTVVHHLIRGCPVCGAAMASFAEGLLEQERSRGKEAASRGPVLAEDPGYDDAIDRVIESVHHYGRDAAFVRAKTREVLSRIEKHGIDGLADSAPQFKGFAACEALLERSWALRHEDPLQMVELANYATVLADRLSPQPHGPRRLADLRCRIWAALGNAYRVADDLGTAEWALGKAAGFFDQGTGDELLASRLCDLQASLLGAQRRFAPALEALDVVQTIQQRLGDEHLAGRALIKKGIYTGYANDPAAAVTLLAEGFEKIDPAREPALALSAIHNIACFLVDLGRFQEARSLVRVNLWRYVRHGAHLDRIKLRGLQGLIEAGLQNFDLAERELREARTGLAEL